MELDNSLLRGSLFSKHSEGLEHAGWMKMLDSECGSKRGEISIQWHVRLPEGRLHCSACRDERWTLWEPIFSQVGRKWSKLKHCCHKIRIMIARRWWQWHLILQGHHPRKKVRCTCISTRILYVSAYSTVDGRNPAPPVTYETLWNMGYSRYQLVQEFFHQQHQYNHPDIEPSSLVGGWTGAKSKNLFLWNMLCWHGWGCPVRRLFSCVLYFFGGWRVCQVLFFFSVSGVLFLCLPFSLELTPKTGGTSLPSGQNRWLADTKK